MMFELGLAFVTVVVVYIAGTIVYFKFRHQRLIVKKQLDAMNALLSSEVNKVKLEKEVADLMHADSEKQSPASESNKTAFSNMEDEISYFGKYVFSGAFESNRAAWNAMLNEPLTGYSRKTAMTPEILSALYSLIQSREDFLSNLSKARSMTTDKWVLQKLANIEQRYKNEFERETRSLGQISTHR